MPLPYFLAIISHGVRKVLLLLQPLAFGEAFNILWQDFKRAWQ